MVCSVIATSIILAVKNFNEKQCILQGLTNSQLILTGVESGQADVGVVAKITKQLPCQRCVNRLESHSESPYVLIIQLNLPFFLA